MVDAKGCMTTQGMAFWRALWNRTGQGNGLQNQVAVSLTATGTTQATALGLTADWNLITVTPSNSGVVMPPLIGGQAILIANEGLNSLNVYPPSGSQIDALGANA